MTINIALIIGCARSGTSILGELLAAHPQVKYIFEPHEVWERAGAGVNDSHRYVAAHATDAVRESIRQWFCDQQNGASWVVDKTPRNVLRVPFARAVFPEARFIHIVRDGRDVACSMKPGIGENAWQHLKPPGWQQLFAEHDGIERCARAWQEVMRTALADLDGVPHLQVRYERLVAEPREVGREVLEYLGLPEHPAVWEVCRKIQDATADSYHAARQVQWYRPDHHKRVGRWRENLDAAQQQSINNVLGESLARLGYQ